MSTGQLAAASDLPAGLAAFVRWGTRLGWASLVMVYLVICAGSTVRATGSGMGCPDWPRCYGYTIPPTHPDQVTWTSGRDYRQGQMIIHQWEGRDRLLVAQGQFTAGATIDLTNWQPYERHDYAIFNPTHTWIEFINRLLGATTGLPVLLLVAVTGLAAMRGGSWWRAAGSLAVLSVLGFVAWLGKVVVDGNLIPGSITMHMFGAMALIGFLLLVIHADGRQRFAVPAVVKWSGVLFFVALLVQVYLGTQVREQIDHFVKDGLPRAEWADALGAMFWIHRSVSWGIGALALWWWWQQRQMRSLANHAVLALVIAQVVVGVVLAYAGMPAIAQPVHLVLSMILVGCLVHRLLQVKIATTA